LLLDLVLSELASRPGLVDSAACAALAADLRLAVGGAALVLQAGECAEVFADSSPERILAKAAQVHGLADMLAQASGRRTIRVGRLAGQYAKPRSCPAEVLPDGRTVPTYRGDAVNSADADPLARQPHPLRLLRAYATARGALDALAMRHAGPSRPAPPLYVSHEALLLGYEQALVRADVTGASYASSAHLLWVGERTRQPGGAHIAFAGGIANPVAVKVGPSATPAELTAVVARLLPGHPGGGLALITRMGADLIAGRLPGLLDALSGQADQIVWICDPMHGNTRRSRCGRKTRIVADLLSEIGQFCRLLGERGLHPGGLHLETTPDPVTECVWSHRDFEAGVRLPLYESRCDPRLNPEQAQRVVQFTAAQIREQAAGA
jgi:3-deoxy-7-phosphoheptulonate synthase